MLCIFSSFPPNVNGMIQIQSEVEINLSSTYFNWWLLRLFISTYFSSFNWLRFLTAHVCLAHVGTSWWGEPWSRAMLNSLQVADLGPGGLGLKNHEKPLISTVMFDLTWRSFTKQCMVCLTRKESAYMEIYINTHLGYNDFTIREFGIWAHHQIRIWWALISDLMGFVMIFVWGNYGKLGSSGRKNRWILESLLGLQSSQ